jgi:hypothetical protein
MSGLLAASRIPVLLVPERLIVEAARDEGIQLDQLKPVRVERDAVLEEFEMARRVLGRAIERWQELAPSWTRLNFTMQHQSQDWWCWAATSVSVSAYYDSEVAWTQCTMVNAVKGLTTCCEDGASEACDQPNVLDKPLSHADVLDHKQRGSVGYDVIQQEIDAGRPLALRIGWNCDDGDCDGGHFAVIEGYQSFGDEWIAIDDPWYGADDLPLSRLTKGMYQGSGSWTHTYFTRPQPIPALMLDEIRLPWEIWERVRAEDSVVVGEEESR